jgi:hypothetical protein
MNMQIKQNVVPVSFSPTPLIQNKNTNTSMRYPHVEVAQSFYMRKARYSLYPQLAELEQQNKLTEADQDKLDSIREKYLHHAKPELGNVSPRADECNLFVYTYVCR